MSRENHLAASERGHRLLPIVASLAIIQGLPAILRALDLVRVGTDVAARGAMLLPLVGSLIVARGIFVAAIAVLYAVFAWAAFRRKAWAWPVGMLVAVVNALLAVISALTGSGGLGTLLWAVVPVILIVYLLTPTGRGALSNVRPGP